MRVENVEDALGKANSPIKNFEYKKRKHEELKSNDQKWQRPEDRAPPALLTRYTYYVELNTNRAEVFQASEGRAHFRRPFPIQKERANRAQNKYCRYHCDKDMTPMIATNSRMR